ncbi:protein NEN1 [Ziziphus jujuba]|uniref:Protein NEN1 n=1 Tax=Ziziphus jujuba TaxID=326968 RepID=A0ABM3IJX7_ZIZJJ|nr:protein NEN1 [Ziziphus jujuba]
MGQSEDRSEIAFFDVETTVPTRPGQGFTIIEFGAILVCPRKLEELESYSTLVRPAHLSLISSLSVRCNGITRDAVISAPSFLEIADRVYDILQGRIWAGHNIIKFDCARIRDAFADIGRPAPEPKGMIDSLALLTQRFGRRAGDMKMATLATYFGLGQQTHRSLDDVRMNLEVLKYCATVLFLESSLPNVLTTNSWVSPNAITRSRSNWKSSPEAAGTNRNTSSSNLSSGNAITSSSKDQGEAIDMAEPSSTSRPETFNMTQLRHEIPAECHQPNVSMEEKSISESSEIPSSTAVYEGCDSSTVFLGPDAVFIPSISASLVPLYRGTQRIKLLHKDIALQLCCHHLKVRFGINARFTDNAGRPRLNFVVDVPQSLSRVLDSCDDIARKFYLDCGGNSDWRPLVTRKDGYVNYPTVRLHILTAVCGQIAIYATEIYQKECSGSVQRRAFSKFDASELMSLFPKGTFVDAFFSLESYDYQQSAGLRLVAKKLIIHS